MTFSGIADKRSVSMPSDLWDVVDQYKEAHGCPSVSSILAEAVKEFLNGKGFVPDQDGILDVAREAEAIGLDVREILLAEIRKVAVGG